jgi:hypothetical protein
MKTHAKAKGLTYAFIRWSGLEGKDEMSPIFLLTLCFYDFWLLTFKFTGALQRVQ